jgi:hypothetical protein
MAQSPKVVTFEFHEVSNPLAPEQQTTPRGLSAFIGLIAMFAVLATLLLVGRAVSGEQDNNAQGDADEVPQPGPVSTTLPPSSTSTGPPATLASILPLGDAEFVPWPDPPDDHNPHITIIPGPGEPLGDTITESALVYVSVDGRPTVIDLDTGDVSKVLIADARSYDYFSVEFGDVVSLDGRNRNIEIATDRAVVFHAYKEGTNPSTSAEQAAGTPGPLLCISSLPCEITNWRFSTTNGVDTIRALDSAGDPELYEMLYGESWTVDGLHRNAPGDFGFDYRVPAALNGDAWIVHQPRSEQRPSMTRVG